MQKPEVVFQPKTAVCFQEGVNQIVDAIKPTLGPFPRFVVYDDAVKGMEFLDDGGTIARRIVQISDRDADMGAMYVRQLLWQLRESVGDGVATAAVLFQTIFNEGLRFIASGGNAMRLRTYLEQGLKIILLELDAQTFQVAGKEKLAGLAETICHDPELAKLLGEIFDIIGEHGHLELRNGRSRQLDREYVEGMYWSGGILSRHFLAPLESKINLENSAILISDLEITDRIDLGYVLQIAVQAKFENILLVVKSISDEMIGLLVGEFVKEKITAVPVKLRTIDQSQIREVLQDLAVLTGGRPILREAGQTAQSVTVADFGKARRSWADLKHFGLSGGKGDPRQLRQHIFDLRAAHARSQKEETRQRIQTRIGKLMGGTAILRISGATETELKSRKAVAERTARVLRGAVTTGVIPGGGTALLACQCSLGKQLAHHSEPEARAAYQILSKAMESPIKTLIKNAGDEPDEFLGQIKRCKQGAVYDIREKKIVEGAKAGIVDVAAVQKEAVERAVRSAALALTVDVLIHVKKPQVSMEP